MKTRLALAGTTALLVLPGCSGSKTKAEPDTSTSSLPAPSGTNRSTPRTATATDPNEQLVGAERAFWDLYLQLGARTGAFDPTDTRERLRTRTTSRELATLFDVFQGNAAAGYVVKGTIDIAPSVVSIIGDTAQVRDCYDDKTRLYRSSDSVRIDNEDPRRHKVLITFARQGGAWKVSAIKDEGLGCTA
jgi:hypothetical protein